MHCTAEKLCLLLYWMQYHLFARMQSSKQDGPTNKLQWAMAEHTPSHLLIKLSKVIDNLNC